MKLRLKGHPPVLSPPPPPSYPAEVVTAGLQAVWDLYTTSGSRVSSYTAFGSLTPVPGGVTRTTNVVGPACGISSTASMSGVDFSGYGLWISATGTVATLTDCSIPGASTLRVFNGTNPSGSQVGAPTLGLEHVTMNLAGGEIADHAMLQNTGPNCAMTINGCRIYASPRTGANIKGNLNLTNTLWGAFGTTFVSGDHTECIQLSDGTFVIDGCLFDPTYGGTILSGITGCIQLQALNGVPTSLTISNSIFANSAGLLDAPLSFKADFANITVTLTNNVIQKGMQSGAGRTGYIIPAVTSGRTLTIIDSGNNIDFDDGHTLSLGGVLT